MKTKVRFTIRTKLLLMSIISITAAVSTLGVFLSLSFSRSAYETASRTLESVASNATLSLESDVSSAESSMVLLANQIGYNKDFANNILDASTSDDAIKHLRTAFAGEDQSGDGSTIIGAMEYLIYSNKNIESATMYSPLIPEDKNVYNRLFNTSFSKVECTNERYQALLDNPGEALWFLNEADQDHIYVWKALVNFGIDDNYNMKVVGYIEYVFYKGLFLSCLTDTSYQDEGMVFIDENNAIILAMPSGDAKVDDEVLSNIDEITRSVVKHKSFTSYRNFATNKGWSYVAYIHHKSIQATITKNIWLSAAVILASIIVASLISFLLATKQVSVIKKLSSAASSVSQGKYDIRVPEVANDEITDVSASFNSMAEKVQETLNELIEQQDSISENFATILANKSGESGYHVKRVSEYSAILAKSLGFTENEVHDIRIASMLHDVGKIMVDENILHKPARFTDEEYEIMKQHVVYGGQLLKGVPGNIMQLGSIIAQYHHERWDGQGYCHKLSGDDIPLEAQIASVADVFDALVSKRCYKSPWTIEDAYNEMVAQSGKQFSPRVIETFKECFEEFKEVAEKYRD